MSRHLRKLSGFAIMLTIFLLVFGSGVVMGQGGTGRETPKTPAKTAPPTNRTSTSRQSSCTAQSPTQATGRTHTVTLKGGVNLEMVEVPAGTFCMGSTNGDVNEKPVHKVTISQAFYMGKYEITQAQWEAVMGNNPSSFKGCGGNCPVEQVSWEDALNFVNKLNESNDGFKYRLPSEAEWEYACRAGTTTPFSFGSTLSSEQANFNAADYPYGGAAVGHYRGKPTPVGSFTPNGFGLFDMHGNVWEWCQDWYHGDEYNGSYNGAPADGSAWLRGGAQKWRVLRGGAWKDIASYLRSAIRFTGTPDYRIDGFGFRVVAVR